VSAVIKDVKTYSPTLLSTVDEKTIKSADDINSLVVENLLKTAPKAPTKRKPFKSELDDTEGDLYKKYFKPVD
jgi:hypothetical protein